MSDVDKEKIEFLEKKLFVYEHEASKLIETNRVGRCLSAFGELASAIKPDMLRSFCKALGDTFTKAESENFCSTFDQFPVPPTREEYLQSEIARLEAECAALKADADRFKTVFAAWLDMDSIDMGLCTEVSTEKWDAFCELMLPNDAEFIAMQAGEKL